MRQALLILTVISINIFMFLGCNKKNPTDIEIIPATTTLRNSETQQLTCTATYSDNSTQDVTSSAAWSTNPGTAGSVSSGGLFTAFSSVTGTEMVTASYDGEESTATVTVLARPVTGTVTDVDGNVYQTVKIGNQWWMAENLNVTCYRNGDVIPCVTDNSTWSMIFTGSYCHYDDDPNNAITFGSLYNWYAVSDSINIIAPEGWHVPTDEEWKELEMVLGMSQSQADSQGDRGIDEGVKLKGGGTSYWHIPDYLTTNEGGFSALPGGCRFSEGLFSDMGQAAYFWSSTESSSLWAWKRELSGYSKGVNRSSLKKGSGLSVRCVKD